MKNIIRNVILMTLVSFCSIGKAANQIRFGVDYFYPPFVFSAKSGYVHGFDIDVARAICQELKAQCTFTPMSLSEMFNSVEQNKIDAAMGAISITPERKAKFAFTRPYLKSSMNFVTLSSTVNFDPNNLTGKKIGAVKESTFARYLQLKYANSIRLLTYNTNEELTNALSNRELDAILIDTPAANFWIGYSTGLFKTVGKALFLNSDQGYGIVINKNNTGLVNDLNNALNTIIQNGTFEKIRQSYFNKKNISQD